MKINNRITIYYGSGSALDLVFKQVAKKKDHDYIKHLLALGVASFYGQEVVNKKDSNEVAIAAFAAMHKRPLPPFQTVPKGTPIEGPAIVVDHGNHLHVLPLAENVETHEPAPVTEIEVAMNVDEKVVQEVVTDLHPHADAPDQIIDTGEYPPPGSDQAVKEWEEDVAARRFAAEDLPPRPVSDFPPHQPEPEISAADAAERSEKWREFVAAGGELPAQFYQETELPDLAKLQERTDADQAEREEVREMLADLRKNQGTDPLEEAKKNVEKAKEFWSRQKSDGTGETQ